MIQFRVNIKGNKVNESLSLSHLFLMLRYAHTIVFKTFPIHVILVTEINPLLGLGYMDI